MSTRVRANAVSFSASAALLLALNLSVVNVAFGQIAQRGIATSATLSGGSVTIVKPAGVVAGDIMIANIAQNDNDDDNLSNAGLAGWTVIDGRSLGSSGDNSWWGTVLYRVADGMEGANFAFDVDDDANGAVGAIIAFSGVNVTGGVQADGSSGGPFDIDPGILNVSNAATITATSITTVSDNAAIIMLAALGNDVSISGWQTATSPGALTELYDVTTGGGADNGVGAAWALQTAAGSTGNGTATISSTRNGGILLALKACSTANAGPDQEVCAGGTITLDGSIGGSATSSTWSAPSGSFGDASSLTSTYTPSITSGSVILTLTTNDPDGAGPCTAAVGTMTVTINPLPATTGVTICQGGSGNLLFTSDCDDINGTEGPNFAGAAATGGGAGNQWTNTGNIGNDDGNAVTCDVSDGSPGDPGDSENLNITNFDFNIPPDAVIDGITVEMNRWTSGITSPLIQDLVVQLMKDGVTPVGTNKANLGADWSTSTATVATYGASNDLWGTTWTPAEVNASTFGVTLDVINPNNSSDRTASVDYVSITIAYTINGEKNWFTVSIGGSSIGSGSPFNPVGVAGSGLPNTNTPGTYTYYAECSTIPGCRTATNFVINAAATADAGGPYATCGTTDVGIEATANGTGTWSGGLGSFADASNPSTSYQPHASEIGTTVMLTWTTNDPDGAGPCASANDVASLTVGTPAGADAGGPYSTCGTNPVAIAATASGPGSWSGGAGTFASPTSASTTYTPAMSELGTAFQLTWTTDDPDGAGACQEVSDGATLMVYGQEIEVKGGNGVAISNGDVTPVPADQTDFGWTTVAAGAITRTFIIENTGSSPLTLSGGTPVTLSGPHAGDFSVTIQPSSPVIPLGSTSFEIVFDPSVAGMRNATVNIANNDCDEAPFTFDITGKGTVPQAISVFGNGNQIANRASTASVSDDTDFGSVSTGGGMLSHTFTISNIVNGSPLLLTGVPKVTIADRDAADFTVTTQPSSPVDGGGSTTFTVKFQPSAAGLRTAIVIITHNDLPENPFVFTLNGTGL